MSQKRAKVGDKVVLTDPINYGKVVEVTDIDDDGFIVYDGGISKLYNIIKQNNKTMEFKVYRTWYLDSETKMKFDSLEELLDFTKQKQQQKESVEGLIISWNEDEKIWEAEIYDGYRE